MKVNYFKLAWNSVRQHPVVSIVSIVGTALAIFLIMVVVMLIEVGVAPYAPESNRDRWLVQEYGTIINKDWGESYTSNGPIGYNTVKEMFYPMETPEAVTAFTVDVSTALLAVPGQPGNGYELKDVDNNFWKVMDFNFVAGKPFTKEDFDAGLPVAVLSESTARKVFGTIEAVGRELLINYVPYKVVGVVSDVSNIARFAAAEVWVPFTATNRSEFSWCDYMGGLSVIMLAKDKADLPKIREEYDRRFDDFNRKITDSGWRFIKRERPYTQEVNENVVGANQDPDMASVRRTRLIVFLILLIVPAVNLTSMTQSRLRSRREEIGIRRAFGARRSSIMTEILIENLIITVAAGMAGLLMSVVFGLIWGASVFGPDYSASIRTTEIDMSILFHWSTFGWALLFCFLLNLLSAGLPSFGAARTNIVNALSGRN